MVIFVQLAVLPLVLEFFSKTYYSGLYENDHFNQAQAEFKKVLNGQSKQAQAEFKKVLNGQSKHAAQKKGEKRRKKKGVRQGVAWYTHSKRLTI